MPSRSVLRALLVLGLAALGMAACAHSGTPRICFSVGALVVTALLARVLPPRNRLPHPAIRSVLVVIGGVSIIAAAFGVYLVVVLSEAPAPVLVGVALVLAALAVLVTRRPGSSGSPS